VPGWPIDHCARAAVESVIATAVPTKKRLKIPFMPESFRPLHCACGAALAQHAVISRP
jgi:hypothetical protein